ncbi:MAG: response regulator [Rhodospirillales bacterium]|nr:response regulator [Rhodospirillales bacterium]MBO6785797.1 response regulator [Rhodospirillales bacterium]
MSARVLLAEDEENILTSLTFLLERAGYDVSVETEGPKVLKAALSTPPDVLVLDVMLPDMDGYEILRRLRASPATERLPVLMLTAKGQREDRETALRCGADLFITKPFANSEIINAIGELAEKRLQ